MSLRVTAEVCRAAGGRPDEPYCDMNDCPCFCGAAPEGALCFFCSTPLSHHVIHWMGGDVVEAGKPNNIYLHPQCVIELALRLFRDVHELECKGDLCFVVRPDLRVVRA